MENETNIQPLFFKSDYFYNMIAKFKRFIQIEPIVFDLYIKNLLFRQIIIHNTYVLVREYDKLQIHSNNHFRLHDPSDLNRYLKQLKLILKKRGKIE